MISLNTRGSAEFKTATATAVTRAMRRMMGASDAEITNTEAPTRNPQLTNLVSGMIGAPVAPVAATARTQDVVGGEIVSATPQTTATTGAVTVNVSNGTPPRSPSRANEKDVSTAIVSAAPTTLAEFNVEIERFRDDPEMRAALRDLMMETMTAPTAILRAKRALAENEVTNAEDLHQAKKLREESARESAQRIARVEERGKEAIASIESAAAAAKSLNESSVMDATARRAVRNTIMAAAGIPLASQVAAIVTSKDIRAATVAVEDRVTVVQHALFRHGVRLTNLAKIKVLRSDVFAAFKATFGKQAATFVDNDKVIERIGRSKTSVHRYAESHLAKLASVFERHLGGSS